MLQEEQVALGGNNNIQFPNLQGFDNQQVQNPLLAMLNNLGMNLGGTSNVLSTVPSVIESTPQSLYPPFVASTTRHLLPHGINAICAEDLERRLINSEETREMQTNQSKQNISFSKLQAEKSGTMESATYPPGFSPTVAITSVSGTPSTIVPTPNMFSPFGLVASPSPIVPLIPQNHFLSRSPNLQGAGFPLGEGLPSSTGPFGNSGPGNFIHSPFGFGLPIGGLQHMIGATAQGNTATHPTLEGSSIANKSSTADSSASLATYFPNQVEVLGELNDAQQIENSPTSTIPSAFFPVQLNQLLNVTPSASIPVSPINPTAEAQLHPQQPIFWPPK